MRIISSKEIITYFIRIDFALCNKYVVMTLILVSILITGKKLSLMNCQTAGGRNTTIGTHTYWTKVEGFNIKVLSFIKKKMGTHRGAVPNNKQ